MPFIETSQEWLTLSSQLLEARPTTVHSTPSTNPSLQQVNLTTLPHAQTRITTKYSITRAKARAAAKKTTTTTTDPDTPMPDAAASKPPRGKLILKTFDPASGVCLKYKTAKAAEVGRLVQMLGSLGRNMGGLKAAPMIAAAVEEDAAATAAGASTPVGAPAAGAGGAAGAAVGGGDGAKGKKKKKGKK